MRYLGRLLVYLAIFFFTLSVSSVLIARVIPVTVTPLKVLRLVENVPDKGLSVQSNWVPLHRINLSMVRAVIAINKALDENREGGRIRGGSTISQQTAKNVFCLPSRTWTRKAVEAYYTFLIETFWDKRRIMEVYLNVIETGENMYGVEAPARQVYGKTAEHLNRHEASMIASVLPNPIRMKIAAPSSYVVRRAAQVRSLMSKLPPVDFDDPQPVVPARDRRK